MSVIINKDNLPDIDLDTSSFVYNGNFILIQDEYICDVLKCMNVPEIDVDDFYDICICGYFIDYPEVLERYASKSPNNAYYYASLVIKGRFELGEKSIATVAKYSYLYARDTLEGRFEIGEQIIATDAEYSYRYAFDVFKGRFELGEEVIAAHADCSYIYARSIIKGRFKLGEHAILNSNWTELYRELFLCQ